MSDFSLSVFLCVFAFVFVFVFATRERETLPSSRWNWVKNRFNSNSDQRFSSLVDCCNYLYFSMLPVVVLHLKLCVNLLNFVCFFVYTCQVYCIHRMLHYTVYSLRVDLTNLLMKLLCVCVLHFARWWHSLLVKLKRQICFVTFIQSSSLCQLNLRWGRQIDF